MEHLISDSEFSENESWSEYVASDNDFRQQDPEPTIPESDSRYHEKLLAAASYATQYGRIPYQMSDNVSLYIKEYG
jgi:hypothetical protein